MSAPALAWGHILVGCDVTQGIVSVDADSTGHARVWRRVGHSVEQREYRFPNWFLTTSLDLLNHLPATRLPAEILREAHGRLSFAEPLAIVELDTDAAPDDDVYRYLVLTTILEEVETAMVEMSNKHLGDEAQSLADLRGLVLVWHPIEQFLMLTGRTYFKGLRFDDLRRLQFDLETTGLDEDRDRIFMISMRDSSGWRETLESSASTEGEVLERFVAIVRERDPDVLENHNIFGFDLSFLVKRAARLGVMLGIGRDGSEPRVETDVFDTGERGEPFLRWRVAGREVVDTQQAVRRFSAGAPDMRRHGLKDAARYFGFARADREYVPGIEVWPTYQTDPDRIRRYAGDDVEEVDGLSRRLLPPVFSMAAMLPRPYERIAADCGPTSLWEPLLVRGYLHEGRAIAAPMPRLQDADEDLTVEAFITGVVGAAARVSSRPLLPCVLAGNRIAAANDDLGMMPWLVREVLDTPNAELLAQAGQAYLSGHGLFSDPQAASRAALLAREYVDRVVGDLSERGGHVVEVDGEQVLFTLPPNWSESMQRDLAAAAGAYLPDGVRLVYGDEYQAVYIRGARSSITLGRDGEVTLVGSAFRPGRMERFGESFIQRAAPFVLLGDAVGLRQVFVETIHLLRSAQVPLEDLCVQVTLYKSPPQYRRGGTHEEPYEVLLAAGVRSWRVGQRIRYFRARGGEARLLHEGDEISAAEADTEYYVQRLVGVYCHQFAQAFRREDFLQLFRVPSGIGPFVEPEMEAELRAIHPIAIQSAA